MSDDPETARQIAELARDTRPLLVLDVDEVLLEFVRPFIGFLGIARAEIRHDVVSPARQHLRRGDRHAGRQRARRGAARRLLRRAGRLADRRADGAAEAIAGLAEDAEIVMLTAMPHKHRAVRRAHLDALGFPYPLLTTETAKGPAIRQLRGEHPRPVAFVDDIPHNLVSVRATVADAHLFHLMAHQGMRALLPPLPDGIDVTADWADAGPRIAAALGLRIASAGPHPISSETIFPPAITNVLASVTGLPGKLPETLALSTILPSRSVEFERLDRVIVFPLGLGHPCPDGGPALMGPALVADHGIGRKALRKAFDVAGVFGLHIEIEDWREIDRHGRLLSACMPRVAQIGEMALRYRMTRTDEKVRYLPESKVDDVHAGHRRQRCRAGFKFLEGRWKLLILFHLFGGKLQRFSELERAIPAISQKMLIQQLRQMETDGSCGGSSITRCRQRSNMA